MRRVVDVSHNPLIAALDTSDRGQILSWADALKEEVGLLKVGLQATYSLGLPVVKELAAMSRLFWDLKLHDIPNTVEGAAAAAQDLGVEMLTVHASGGPNMIAAAAKAAKDVKVLAVTVLTSLSAEDQVAVGQRPAEEQVVRLARLAIEAGAAGIVCSPLEVAKVRLAVGQEPVLVVPGIRPAGAIDDDQARVATPADAMAAGADHLVIGRPITRAEDPAQAAREILDSLGR